jgi:3-hydroxyisobutyrate dehydrogenase-like beta-hydroxyacid dehydrogenase
LAVSSSGADFVKIAIMAPILDRGFAVPLLAGGGKSSEAARLFSALGLTIRATGPDPRQPAALKILRSICLKGVVALAYEMLRGAQEYGIADEVFESASEAMSKASFKDTVGGWLASTFTHAKRRAGEMQEAAETLEALGIRPVMSQGTKEVFEEIARLKLDETLKGVIPDSYDLFFKKLNEVKAVD